MKKLAIALLALFVLTACGDQDESPKELSADEAEKIINEGTVGFEIADGNIEEAANVPPQEKEKIKAAFNEYMDAFNEKDIARYKETISSNAAGFDYDADIAEVEKVFEQYSEINRTAKDVTVVKYEENEAQVFSNMTAEMVEKDTEIPLIGEARTVIVFVKENDAWKVSSVHSMSN